MTELNVILMSPAEIQSHSDRVKWAEGLILQLPADHEGRNSWLLNYGKGQEADLLRVKHGFNQFDWVEDWECLAPQGDKYKMPFKVTKDTNDMFTKAVAEIIPMFNGMEDRIIKSTESDFVSFCHSQISGGIGMKIRNHFKLWDPESELSKFFKVTGIANHPDTMSSALLRAVHAEITKVYKPKPE
jgi:hypothetical protein